MRTALLGARVEAAVFVRHAIFPSLEPPLPAHPAARRERVSPICTLIDSSGSTATFDKVSAPLHLQLHLANGRRAELPLSDERQLPRVLALLEEPL